MEFTGNIKWISPIILTMGGLSRKESLKQKASCLWFLISLLITIQGTYDIVDMVGKLGTYIKVGGG